MAVQDGGRRHAALRQLCCATNCRKLASGYQTLKVISTLKSTCLVGWDMGAGMRVSNNETFQTSMKPCRMGADDTLQAASQVLQALEERQRSPPSPGAGQVRGEAQSFAEPLLTSRSTNSSSRSGRPFHQHLPPGPRTRTSSSMRLPSAFQAECRCGMLVATCAFLAVITHHFIL